MQPVFSYRHACRRVRGMSRIVRMLRGYYEETVPWNFNFAAHAVHVNNFTGHLAFRRHKLSSVLVSPSDNTGDGQTDRRTDRNIS